MQSRLSARAIVVEGPGRQPRRDRQAGPLHRPGPALAARGADPRAGQLGHRQAQPDDGRHPQPLVAVLLVAVVGRVGVPGRLRPALLRVLRAADRTVGRGRVAAARAGPRQCGAHPEHRDAAQLVRPGDRRRRHAGGLPERRHRQRHDGRAVRLGGERQGGRDARQLRAAPRVPRGQRPDLRRLRSAVRADGRPGDRRRDSLDSERGRHRRARAQHPPLLPRAPRVHPPPVRTGRARRAPDGRRRAGGMARRPGRAAASTWAASSR